jgi:hypothetical protein
MKKGTVVRVCSCIPPRWERVNRTTGIVVNIRKWREGIVEVLTIDGNIEVLPSDMVDVVCEPL